MAAEFDEWVGAVVGDERLGALPAGGDDLLREVYDTHGPVGQSQLAELGLARQIEFARLAARLVARDVAATTGINAPQIDAYIRDDMLIVAWGGNIEAPAMHSVRSPESICEVADNLRDHVMDEVWTVWPVCPEHDRVLDPLPVDGRPVWVCPTGDHIVAEIGHLPRH